MSTSYNTPQFNELGKPYRGVIGSDDSKLINSILIIGGTLIVSLLIYKYLILENEREE